MGFDEIPGLKIYMGAIFSIFGSLLGSFSNVVILRTASGKSIVFPPSSCPHCGHQLSAFDLIPVFGWIFLGGKCRYCRAPISGQYPLVEAAAAIIMGSAFLHAGFTRELIPGAGWGIIWLVISVMNLRGEIATPAPFLWAVLYGLGLGFLANRSLPEGLIPMIAVAAVCTVISSRGRMDARAGRFFGTGLSGMLTTLRFGPWFPASLCVIAVLDAVLQRRAEKWEKRLRIATFVWNLAGIALGVTFGFW